eukprot:5480131-Heterocapsa_arctica.AAC.1
MWCLEDEYVGYHMTAKGKTKEEGTALWKLDVANVEIKRRGDAKGLRIAVMAIPTSTEVIARTGKRSLQATYCADTEQQMQAASKRMALNNLPGMNTQNVHGCGRRDLRHWACI